MAELYRFHLQVIDLQMFTVKSSLVATDDVNSDQKKIDISETIHLLEPNAAPLFVLTSRLKKKATHNPKFQWLEDDHLPHWTQINNGGGYTNGDTSLVVDDASFFQAGDIIKIPRTAEVLRVTAVNTSTNTLTVTRSWGSTAAAAINDNDFVLLLGSAYAEGASVGTARIKIPSTKHNFTEIVREFVDLTNTQNATDMYGTNDYRAYLRKKKGIEFKKQIEYKFWFGEKNEDLSGTEPRRTTGGVQEFVTKNALNAKGNLTLAEFLEWMGDVFRYGSEEKWLFASPKVISQFEHWMVGKLELRPKDETFGLVAKRFVSGHGAINLVKHKLFEKAYDGYAWLLDVDKIVYRYMQGRDVKLLLDVQNPGDDKTMDEYRAEVGLEFALPDAHGYIYNVA